MDSAVIVGKGPCLTLQNILGMRQRLHLSNKYLPDSLNWSKFPIFWVSLELQSDPMASLLCKGYCEREHAASIGVPLSDFYLLQVQCLASEYVSGYVFPLLKQDAWEHDHGKTIFFKKHFERTQRVVSWVSIYCSKPPGMDDVIVKPGKEDDGALLSSKIDAWIRGLQKFSYLFISICKPFGSLLFQVQHLLLIMLRRLTTPRIVNGALFNSTMYQTRKK